MKIAKHGVIRHVVLLPGLIPHTFTTLFGTYLFILFAYKNFKILAFYFDELTARTRKFISNLELQITLFGTARTR
jgi:hypothetical protein